MNAKTLEILSCRWDGAAMRFVAAPGAIQDGPPEGLLVCSNYPSCAAAHLVVEGIIVALPISLMKPEELALLRERLKIVEAREV